MKLYYYFLFAILSCSVYSQTNSVLLKDSSGTLIGEYSSLTTAYDALPDSIVQPYIIEIQMSYRGTDEIFPIVLGPVPGSSVENQIIIRPSGEVLITANVDGGAVIKLDGCTFVTIDGREEGYDSTNSLIIENTSQSGPTTHTIEITGTSKNNTVRFCTVIGHTRFASWSPGVIELQGSSWSPEPENNEINNCRILGGARGIYFRGWGECWNNIITNCIIEDFSGTGIFLEDTRNTRVLNNTIRQNTPSHLQSRGIAVYSGTEDDTIYITGNKILSLQSTSTSIAGIYINISRNYLELYIINNFISLNAENPDVKNVYGIIFTDDGWSYSFTAHVVKYNTISILGEYASNNENAKTTCIYRSSTAVNSIYVVLYNIFINMRKGGNENSIHSGSISNNTQTYDVEYDHNIYYAAGSPYSYCAGWDTNYYNNLNDYKAAAYPEEYNTLFRDVDFIAPDDLHLTTASWRDPQLKAPSHPEMTDIDGDPRVFSYKGADELPVILGSPEGDWDEKAEKFILYDNFPNPFNPSTTIRYSIPAGLQGRVILNIYDILGIEIASLINEDKTSGEYQIEWDASSFSSGVYFYRLTFLPAEGGANFITTKKLQLIK